MKARHVQQGEAELQQWQSKYSQKIEECDQLKQQIKRLTVVHQNDDSLHEHPSRTNRESGAADSNQRRVIISKTNATVGGTAPIKSVKNAVLLQRSNNSGVLASGSFIRQARD